MIDGIDTELNTGTVTVAGSGSSNRLYSVEKNSKRRHLYNVQDFLKSPGAGADKGVKTGTRAPPLLSVKI
jgi:hypothetical protein